MTMTKELWGAARSKIISIMIGGCNCDTKTNEVKYHKERCPYRLAAELDILIERIDDENNLLHLDAAIAGTETGQYWKGSDDGYAGTMMRWEQALTMPIPATGTLGDEKMQRLYQKTEGIRTMAQKLAEALYNVYAWAPATEVAREQAVLLLSEYYKDDSGKKIAI